MYPQIYMFLIISVEALSLPFHVFDEEPNNTKILYIFDAINININIICNV